MGRTRQNTRTEPFKSSTALWIRLRRCSASRNDSSGTPTRFAATTASWSATFASFKASRSSMSNAADSLKAHMTSSRAFLFVLSSSRSASARRYSGDAGSRLTTRAFSRAASNAPTSAPTCSADNSPLTSNFGSSRRRRPSALAKCTGSAPRSRQWSIAFCNAATSLDSNANRSAASASARLSATTNAFANPASPSSPKPTARALSSAAWNSAMSVQEPAGGFAAISRRCRAACIVTAVAKARCAAKSSACGTPTFSAMTSAFRN
mmetsp:Transcript_103255/g.298706  ORF Transcript_103255/g.298706 Transcript_103255/m.298706 type:complete len:265 (+) Transcript_103255:1314-2108(+)